MYSHDSLSTFSPVVFAFRFRARRVNIDWLPPFFVMCISLTTWRFSRQRCEVLHSAEIRAYDLEPERLASLPTEQQQQFGDPFARRVFHSVGL